jgi:hypothetical protein
MIKIPKFRILQLDFPMPITGNKFFIHWEVEFKKEKKILWGLWTYEVKEMIWDRYIDPTKGEAQQGYTTMEQAVHAINVYKNMLTPVYHYID